MIVPNSPNAVGSRIWHLYETIHDEFFSEIVHFLDGNGVDRCMPSHSGFESIDVAIRKSNRLEELCLRATYGMLVVKKVIQDLFVIDPETFWFDDK